MVRRTTVLQTIDRQDLSELQDSDLVREGRSLSGEPIFSIRIPELLASELSALLSAELRRLAAESAASAASWLAEIAGRLPFGDIIAAHALVDAGRGGLSLAVVTALLNSPPEATPLPPGAVFQGIIPSIGTFRMTKRDDGSAVLHGPNGEEEIEGDDFNVALSNLDPFLILAHLARHPFAVSSGTADSQRVDPQVLVSVASAGVVLRRPDPAGFGGVLTHDVTTGLSVVCHRAGIVESITWSLFQFLGREDEAMRDAFIDFALDPGPPALLARLDIALRQLARSADSARAEWARRVRNEKVTPRLQETLASFVHE